MLAAEPSRADERKRDESRAISSSARARVSSMHARGPVGKDAAYTRDETRRLTKITTTITTTLDADADEAREDDNDSLVSAPAAGQRRVRAKRNGASSKRMKRARTHTHAPAVWCYSRASRPPRGLRLRSTPALGPARHRSARLDPTRFDSARLRATPRGADNALRRARERQRAR